MKCFFIWVLTEDELIIALPSLSNMNCTADALVDRSLCVCRAHRLPQSCEIDSWLG